MFLVAIILLGIAYVIGSLNSAILVCKALKLADPRTQGSGNPGATNVLRMAGKKAALIVLAGDALKGLVPVMLAHMLGLTGLGLASVALASVIGHIFPVFFKFKGGKGVATAFGGLFALATGVAIIAAIVWAVVVFVTKYVSLASLIATVLAVVLILFTHLAYFLPMLAMAALVIWRHQENIVRLKTRVETKANW